MGDVLFDIFFYILVILIMVTALAPHDEAAAMRMRIDYQKKYIEKYDAGELDTEFWDMWDDVNNRRQYSYLIQCLMKSYLTDDEYKLLLEHFGEDYVKLGQMWSYKKIKKGNPDAVYRFVRVFYLAYRGKMPFKKDILNSNYDMYIDEYEVNSGFKGCINALNLSFSNVELSNRPDMFALWKKLLYIYQDILSKKGIDIELVAYRSRRNIPYDEVNKPRIIMCNLEYVEFVKGFKMRYVIIPRQATGLTRLRMKTFQKFIDAFDF